MLEIPRLKQKNWERSRHSCALQACQCNTEKEAELQPLLHARDHASTGLPRGHGSHRTNEEAMPGL